MGARACAAWPAKRRLAGSCAAGPAATAPCCSLVMPAGGLEQEAAGAGGRAGGAGPGAAGSQRAAAGGRGRAAPAGAGGAGAWRQGSACCWGFAGVRLPQQLTLLQLVSCPPPAPLPAGAAGCTGGGTAGGGQPAGAPGWRAEGAAGGASGAGPAAGAGGAGQGGGDCSLQQAAAAWRHVPYRAASKCAVIFRLFAARRSS